MLQGPATHGNVLTLHKDKQACIGVSFGSGTDLGCGKHADAPYVVIRSGSSVDLCFHKDVITQFVSVNTLILYVRLGSSTDFSPANTA